MEKSEGGGRVMWEGSPLLPVVFLIWMAPILKKMEARVRKKAGEEAVAVVDTELPSFIDDMCADIVVWEGGGNMQRVESNVKRIVGEVAEECRLPLETDKEEILHLRRSRKKKNADRMLNGWESYSTIPWISIYTGNHASQMLGRP